MDSRIKAHFDSMKNKRIAFCGIGRSNLPLTLLYRQKGAVVYACDRKTREELGSAADEMEKAGVILRCGEDYLRGLDVDVIFRAPGMYFHSEQLREFMRRGVAVTSEMEVFFDLCPCKIYAITGTDGKTTTTSIVSEILARAGYRVHKGGNIGRPLLPIIEQIEPTDIAVVELSSFQLISMRRSPDVAAITNIYPDHLNVHKDMEEYVGAKKNLFLHQNAFSRAVLNGDNELTSGFESIVRGDLYTFSRTRRVERGAFLESDGMLCFSDGKTCVPIVHKDEIKIPGMHNVENYLTAIAMVYGAAEPAVIADVARTFSGVEHRIEFVRELDGVRYYNDSIATSPASVIAGLNSFDRRMIIIAGGSDKGLNYGDMSDEINKRVKLLILLGETADKIEAAVRASRCYDPAAITIIRAKTLEQAVEIARENAKTGDIVSLSPASASFDMYKDFEERGNHFKSIVNNLK
ncbi:MAG: UDP-N-acetylmuramoyl-L-alanine--D-glutamate ligase [Acutalibacteraceae bacterium]